MLQTCGIASKVSLNMNDRLSNLPDGRGGMAYYKSKKLWRILVGSNDLQKLLDLGFSPKRLIIDKHTPQRNATQFVKISKITDNNRTDKTFCFNEPLRHAGVFNGVITSNCTEIIEYSDENQTAVCNLASIGLSKFVYNKIPSGGVKVYSKSNCKYCKRVKKFLIENNISFEEINLDGDKERHNFYDAVKLTQGIEINKVPQIFIGDNLIGGYDKLKQLVKPEFNYKLLHSVTKIVIRNLNKVIDVNFYPTDKTKRSNYLHRPIGLGIQGLADVFALLNIPFHSEEAKQINRDIFETIYHASVQTSMEISRDRMIAMHSLRKSLEKGEWKFANVLENEDVSREYEIVEDISGTLAPKLEKYTPILGEINREHLNLLGSYSSFEGSPAHAGKLQFDLWDVKPSDRYNWDTLKFDIRQHGMRNSLLLAPMPTASTSQILGNNECFEPFTSNIYVRRTIAGEFVNY